ncbi:MAG: beta-N-acetylhexosaminidase [Thermodesulfobacteriota bacterium]|nr:beta-N-acetylhexosaminidase [Thermodesulfobacteriota bacterium]
MNLSEKIGQRLMVGIKGSALDTETRELLEEIQPGSVILFKRNIVSALQVKELILEIKELLFIPPLIAIDQEGGLVVRFIRDATVFPGNMALGATDSYDLAFKQGIVSSSELKNMGIDMNLAPVVDVITTYDNPGITIRSFGENPFHVAKLGNAYIEGTQAMKVAAVAKHFPGKGAAQADAHKDLPVVSLSRDDFEEVHLLPFQKAIETGVQGVMSTHIYCPSLEGNQRRPATFSCRIVKYYLREKLKFKGVILSDDMEMGAIARYYPIGEACIKASLSGHDFLLICSDYEKQRIAQKHLFNAYNNGELSIDDLGASIERIRSLRDFCESTPEEIDPQIVSIEARDLAQHIADRSITVATDKRGLLPLRDRHDKRIVLILPDLSHFDAIEQGYDSSCKHFFLKEMKAYFSGDIRTSFIPIQIPLKGISNTLNSISRNDTVIACIFDAKANAGQRQLIKRLHRLEAKVIMVLVRNPFDIAFLTPNDTCIITYGFRKNQLCSLLKVMFGKIEAKGSLPFEKR